MHKQKNTWRSRTQRPMCCYDPRYCWCFSYYSSFFLGRVYCVCGRWVYIFSISFAVTTFHISLLLHFAFDFPLEEKRMNDICYPLRWSFIYTIHVHITVITEITFIRRKSTHRRRGLTKWKRPTFVIFLLSIFLFICQRFIKFFWYSVSISQ